MHSENHFASGKVKRPRGPRSSFKVGRATIELEHRAVQLYLRDFIQPADTKQTGGLSQCIRSWKQSGRQSALVDLAITSTALAVYANVKADSLAATAGLARYSSLLKSVKSEIERSNELTQDEFDALLLSMFLMGRFETTMHDKSSSQGDILASFSHHDGVAAVLKTWLERADTSTASDIVKLTRRGQLRSCLLRKRSVPEYLHDGTIYGENGHDLQFDGLLVRLIDACSIVLEMSSNQSPPSQATDKLNVEIETIYAEFQDWSKTLPALTKHFYSGNSEGISDLAKEFYTSDHPADGSVWAHLFVLMLLVTNARFQALQLYGRSISKATEKVMFVSSHLVRSRNLTLTA